MKPRSPNRNLPSRSLVHLGYNEPDLKFLLPKFQRLVGFPR